MDIIIESAASKSTDVVYLPEVAGVTFLASASGPVSMFLNPDSVSSEISDLCEISDLLFFVRYFASQSKGIKFGVYFFDVCCVI